MLATPQTRCYQNVMAKAMEGWMGERQAKATTGNKSRLITAFGNNKQCYVLLFKLGKPRGSELKDTLFMVIDHFNAFI